MSGMTVNSFDNFVNLRYNYLEDPQAGTGNDGEGFVRIIAEREIDARKD
ncbi:MAG: hypothetical protein LBS19_05725 [Clostridiales bacterium]|nr:hypothetical protein [Clostridiales bacterium]